MSDEKVRVPRALKKRFRLKKVLGRGGMGAVFLGVSPGTERPCALKIVATRGNPRHEKRILREARLMSKVRHPHLIEVYDMGVEEEVPWVAMEFVDGRTLSRMRRDGGLNDAERFGRMMLKVGGALDALHREGILHRDVKLGNIMVDRQDRPVLMDLGLAVNDEATRITRTGHLVGTLTYLAPELFSGAPASSSSDWWSMGIALYHAIEGRRPYQPEEIHKYAAARKFEPPAPMIGAFADHPCATAARAMMEPDPARRLSSMEDFRKVLSGEPWVPPEPEEAPTEATANLAPARGPVAPIARAAPFVGAALGGGLAALGAAAVIWSFGRPPGTTPVATSTPAVVEAPSTEDELVAGSPGRAVLEWAERLARDLAKRRPSPRARGVHRAQAKLERLRRRGPWIAAAQLELLWTEAGGDVSTGVHEAWRGRFLQAHQELEKLASRNTDPELGRRRRGWRRRRDRISGADELAGKVAAAFPPQRPDGGLLWMARTYSAAEMPNEQLRPFLGLGADLPAGFDLDRWAGDLRDHPYILLAHTRRLSVRQEALPPKVFDRLARAAAWRPAAGSETGVYWLWLEHQLAVTSQKLLAARGDRGLRERLLTDLDGVFTVLGGQPLLREIGEFERALGEGLLLGGGMRRRRGPLISVRRQLEEAWEAFGAGPEGMDENLREVLRLRVGDLMASLRYGLMDCDAIEPIRIDLRAGADWERLAELGAGGLLQRAAPWYRVDTSPMTEVCRATWDSKGTPLQVVDYEDGWPRRE